MHQKYEGTTSLSEGTRAICAENVVPAPLPELTNVNFRYANSERPQFEYPTQFDPIVNDHGYGSIIRCLIVGLGQSTLSQGRYSEIKIQEELSLSFIENHASTSKSRSPEDTKTR